jgi:hypothetical protein
MTPKTQSVCKHCKMYSEQGKKPGYTACLANMRYHFGLPHEFEPMAEPASTGEPPTLRKVSEGIYTSDTKPHRVDEARIAEIINRAARPSEPSAPQTRVEVNSLSVQKRKHCMQGGRMADFKPQPITAAPQPVSGDTADKWPQHCDLCNQDMESADDRTEWHGLGNCVPVCMVCMGSGIEPATPASTARTDAPTWPLLDHENGDFTDGWNQAIDLCRQAFSKWNATTSHNEWEAEANRRGMRIITLENEVRELKDNAAPGSIPPLKCTCPKTQWTGSEPNDSTCELTEEEHLQLGKTAVPSVVGTQAPDSGAE